MAATFRCTIVTPSESLLDEEVTYVNLPAWDGQTGVMAATSPFLTKLMDTFMSMDTMIGRDFETGLANMKAAAER